MLREPQIDTAASGENAPFSVLGYASGGPALAAASNEVLGRFGFSQALGNYLRLNRIDQPAPYFVFYVDVDGLDSINTAHGQAAGDAVLDWTAEKLTATVRAIAGDDNFLIQRVRDDEFAIGFRGRGCEAMSEANVKRKAADICTLIKDAVAASPFAYGVSIVHVQVTVGASVFNSAQSDALKSQDLIASVTRAAKANQQSKHTAGELGPVHDPEVEVRMAVRTDAAFTIRRALESDRVVNFYQPKVDIRRGTLIGMEALVRVKDDSAPGGYLMPGQFIPHVENTDLINALGIRIIRTALADLRLWNQQGLAMKVAINVSARQLRDEDFAGQIFELLKSEPQVRPSQLIFELVETSGISDIDMAKRTLLRLSELGIEFQLDDFGTGFASFSYLTQLPFSAIKIDQTFVRNIHETKNECIVQACIAIARGHNIRAIAEGVETKEMAQRLMDLGCFAMQGYLIGRPMSKPQLADWLHRYSVDSGTRERTVFIDMRFGLSNGSDDRETAEIYSSGLSAFTA